MAGSTDDIESEEIDLTDQDLLNLMDESGP